MIGGADSTLTATHLSGGLWMSMSSLGFVDANVVLRPLRVEDDFLQNPAAIVLDLEVYSTYRTVCVVLITFWRCRRSTNMIEISAPRFRGRRVRKSY